MKIANHNSKRKLPVKSIKRVKIKIAELFAGVGGFRIGFEGYNGKSAISGYKKPLKPRCKVVFSNQWEPSTKKQVASDLYIKRFGSEGYVCRDIKTIAVNGIPDHDLLVGGFPCKNFSTANLFAKGLSGKKGVVWWEIYRIIQDKAAAGKPVKYLCLENVDRLLRSPVSRRGRDFAIILASLSDLGYSVEWRVINAADYGFPQRRNRVFILAYHETTKIYRKLRRFNDQYS